MNTEEEKFKQAYYYYDNHKLNEAKQIFSELLKSDRYKNWSNLYLARIYLRTKVLSYCITHLNRSIKYEETRLPSILLLEKIKNNFNIFSQTLNSDTEKKELAGIISKIEDKPLKHSMLHNIFENKEIENGVKKFILYHIIECCLNFETKTIIDEILNNYNKPAHKYIQMLNGLYRYKIETIKNSIINNKDMLIKEYTVMNDVSFLITQDDIQKTGETFIKNNDLKLATLSYYQQLIKNENSPEETVFHNITNCYLISNDYVNALLTLFFLLIKTESPGLARVLNKIGIIFYNLKEYSAAAELFKRSINITSGNIKAENNLCCALIKNGDLTEAEHLLKSLIKTGKNHSAHLNYSILDFKRGNTNEAINRLEEILRSKTDFKTAFVLASFYYESGNKEAALKLYNDLSKTFPDNPYVYYNISLIYSEEFTDKTPALKFINKSLSIERHPVFLKLYSKILFEIEKYDEVENICNEILRADKKNCYALKGLYLIYREKSDYSKMSDILISLFDISENRSDIIPLLIPLLDIEYNSDIIKNIINVITGNSKLWNIFIKEFKNYIETNISFNIHSDLHILKNKLVIYFDSVKDSGSSPSEILNFIKDILKPLKRIKLNTVNFDISELINSTLEELRLTYKTIRFSFKDENKVLFKGDKLLLKEALLNLYINSIQKLNNLKIGNPEILTEITVDKKTIRIAVKDNGKNIKDSELNRIFTAFHSDKKEGSGYGLYYLDKIVRLHKGSVSVNNTGELPEFIIQLPVQADSGIKLIDNIIDINRYIEHDFLEL